MPDRSILSQSLASGGNRYECEETSVAVVKKLLAIEPPLTILVSSRPTATVLATLKDCATVCMPQPRSFDDFLAYATIMLNEYPVIAEHLDHNSENIANAAKRIVELSHGLFVLSKVSSNTIINIP
ncbi:hypothetical protein RJZ90_002646 [Blastomyces dermatitidis]